MQLNEIRDIKINVLCIIGALIGITSIFVSGIVITNEAVNAPKNNDVGSYENANSHWSFFNIIGLSVETIIEDVLKNVKTPILSIQTDWGNKMEDVSERTTFGFFWDTGLLILSALFIIGTIMAIITPLGGVLQLIGISGFYFALTPFPIANGVSSGAGLYLGLFSAFIVLASLTFPVGIGYGRKSADPMDRLLTVNSGLLTGKLRRLLDEGLEFDDILGEKKKYPWGKKMEYPWEEHPSEKYPSEKPPENESPSFCSGCGKPIEDGSYCKYCGIPVTRKKIFVKIK